MTGLLVFFIRLTGWVGFVALCLWCTWGLMGLLWMLGRAWDGERLP